MTDKQLEAYINEVAFLQRRIDELERDNRKLTNIIIRLRYEKRRY